MLEIFGRLVIRTFFRDVVVQGRENLPPPGPVIFTPNHPNALLDPLLLGFLTPTFRIRFVAKAPLFRIPLLGWILRSLKAIPVVRRHEAQGPVDYGAFFSACVEALAAGDSIAIFPEGRSLPLPHLIPLRTGAARLFFLAQEKGVDVKIVPVGLNYERGWTFRTSVLVRVGPPLATPPPGAAASPDNTDAVERLTDDIAQAMAQLVFQAKSSRERELMLLLERLLGEDQGEAAWSERVKRLKAFERALTQLESTQAGAIARLRGLLEDYERLARAVRLKRAQTGETTGRLRLTLLVWGGLALATLGWVLNWLPYRLCGVLVRLTPSDQAVEATYKVAYSLFLFPLTYLGEAWLVAYWLDWRAALAFGLLIVPLSYFTLAFYEWRDKVSDRLAQPRLWFGLAPVAQDTRKLALLREQILTLVERLAARIQRPPGASE